MNFFGGAYFGAGYFGAIAQTEQPPSLGGSKARRPRFLDPRYEAFLHEQEKKALVPDGVFHPEREGTIDVPMSRVFEVPAPETEIIRLRSELDDFRKLMANVKNKITVQSMKIHQITLEHELREREEEQEILDLYLNLEDEL